MDQPSWSWSSSDGTPIQASPSRHAPPSFIPVSSSEYASASPVETSGREASIPGAMLSPPAAEQAMAGSKVLAARATMATRLVERAITARGA